MSKKWKSYGHSCCVRSIPKRFQKKELKKGPPEKKEFEKIGKKDAIFFGQRAAKVGCVFNSPPTRPTFLCLSETDLAAIYYYNFHFHTHTLSSLLTLSLCLA